MRHCRIVLLLLASAGLSSSLSAQQSEAANAAKAEKPAGNLEIPQPKENYQILVDTKTGLSPLPPVLVDTADKPEFVREMIRVVWRTGDPIDLWVIRPKVAGKVPAKVPVILYLYSYTDSSDRFHDDSWCKRATADGYAAVGFVSALSDYRFRSRPMKEWFVHQLPEALGATTHDVQLIINYLATRGDLDTDHVGMFGMGSGGTVAILAAHVDPRITALDVLDPWGDWSDWLKNSPVIPDDERKQYLTPEFLSSVTSLDPILCFASLHTPSVRLQQILTEPVTPPAAKQAISDAAPIRATIVKYQNPQELLKAYQVAGLSGWIKQQLRVQSEKSPGQVSAAK